MTARVSVAMAAKNYGRFLPAAIESVQAQTLTDWELVIVDDGSTDDTAAVVRPFLADARIRYHRSDRLGVSRAKNLAWRLSSADAIAFLDADDEWMHDKLERQLAILDANPNVGVVFSRRELIDEESRPLPTPPRTPWPRGRVLPAIFARNFVCFSSATVRRSVLDRVGGFDPSLDLAVDYDLWLRAAAVTEFDYVDAELVRYRTGHGNLSKKLVDRVDIADAIMTRAARRGLLDEVPANDVAEGFASTYRSLGYAMRSSEPRTSASRYLQAFIRGGNRPAAAKGLVGTALSWLRGRRMPGTPENASANR